MLVTCSCLKRKQRKIETKLEITGLRRPVLDFITLSECTLQFFFFFVVVVVAAVDYSMAV